MVSPSTGPIPARSRLKKLLEERWPADARPLTASPRPCYVRARRVPSVLINARHRGHNAPGFSDWREKRVASMMRPRI